MCTLILVALFAQTADDSLIAPAQDTARAQAIFDSGIAAYLAKDYEEAVRLLKQSYALLPRADGLYAWAQAERLRGNCASAVPLYARFIAVAASADEAARARDHLDRCRSLLPRPWYRDITGDALTAAGVVALTVGTVFFSASQRAYDDAESATAYPAYRDAWSAAHHERNAAIAGWVGGGALITAGIIHYVWFSGGDTAPPLTIGISPHGLLLAGHL